MRTLAFIGLVIVACTLPARAEDPFKDGEKAFLKARELLQKQYVDDKVSDDRLWRAATAGLFAGVGSGKWDKLMSPNELNALEADLAGEIVGLGIQISVEEQTGIVNVDGIVAGSGAQKAGLVVGDKILRLDGKMLKGMSQGEVARSMRGKAGTSATLTILRDAEIVTRNVLRSRFTLDAVLSTMLPNAVALVQLRMFSDKTPALLKSALEKAKSAGAKGLVLDLRNNEGGKYDRMLECACELLPKGSLVVTEIHRGGGTAEKRTWTEPVLMVPVVVMTDGATASGAEILAAALKQSGARTVGKRTFGKWNAQSLEDLGNGWGAKFTTMVFRAPSGALPDGRGLDPDVEVEADPRQVARANATKDVEKRIATDAQLRVAVSILKLTR
ncbi:MAG: S41 family peptidase [Polyangia bacterium]